MIRFKNKLLFEGLFTWLTLLKKKKICIHIQNNLHKSSQNIHHWEFCPSILTINYNNTVLLALAATRDRNRHINYQVVKWPGHETTLFPKKSNQRVPVCNIFEHVDIGKDK